MIAEYRPAEWKTETWYELVFDDGRNNGFGFPCDENGRPLIDGNAAAQENYKFALAHPERFRRYNKIVPHEHHYRDLARGRCRCGEEIELYDEYLGACECPNCGRWYNLFGQEVNSPETWPDGDDW